jgi:hypothetical protein
MCVGSISERITSPEELPAAGTLRLAMAQQQAAGDGLQKLSKAFTLADKAMKQMASHGYRLGIGDLFQWEADAEDEKALALLR